VSYYCTGHGHLCCHCETINQWDKPRDWQSGCGGYWLVRCYSCKRVTATIGNRSNPVRVHDLWYAEEVERPEALFSSSDVYGPGFAAMGAAEFAELPVYDDSYSEFEGREPAPDFDPGRLRASTSGIDDRWHPSGEKMASP
jgi:hypothetical protein